MAVTLGGRPALGQLAGANQISWRPFRPKCLLTVPYSTTRYRCQWSGTPFQLVLANVLEHEA
jgi:hypothetical protein